MNQNIMYFHTINDARTFVGNSGVDNWKWGGTASAGRFARFLWAHYSEMDRNNYSAALRAYLRSEGEDPAEYGLMDRKHEKMAWKWAARNQGFEGDFEAWLALPPAVRQEYEDGAAGLPTA